MYWKDNMINGIEKRMFDCNNGNKQILEIHSSKVNWKGNIKRWTGNITLEDGWER